MVLSLISAIGLGLGKIHVCGISLGVTFVFFAGIIAGHFGLSIDPQMLNYAESFGLVIFVYALGLQVGPGFFSSFRKGGVQLNMLATGVVLIGTLLTVVGSYGLGVSLPDMVGILCGATTNTPALGAAQQTLKQMGLESSTPALGCAVAYPLGVVGVILAVLFIRKTLAHKEDLELKEKDDVNKPYIVAFQVHNPAIFNKSIKEIGGLNSYPKFVISRLWRDGNVSIPTSEKIIKEGDRLLVITSEKNTPALTVLFGEQEHTDWNKEDIDWNAIDSQLISQRIVVTRPELNGKKLGSLHLRNHYGINISRVYRSGVQLLATAELTLQLGDRLTVVGEAAAIQNVEKVLGNAVKSLKEPNLVAVFIGIVIGLALGAIPISIPGISAPVRLGLAGGPIIVGILIGTFGPRMHMVTYTTRSANLMLRALGLSLYLACLGLDAGAHFFVVAEPRAAVRAMLRVPAPKALMALRAAVVQPPHEDGQQHHRQAQKPQKRAVKAPHADAGDERAAEEKNVLPCSGFLIVHRMILLFEKAPAEGRFFGISVIGSCGPRRSSAYPARDPSRRSCGAARRQP